MSRSPSGRGWFRSIHDIANHESNEELRREQKPDSIGRPGGGVAHDLNNFLGAILGHTEMLLGTLRDGDPVRGMVGETNQRRPG